MNQGWTARRRSWGVLAGLVLAVTGCGGDDGDGSSAASSAGGGSTTIDVELDETTASTTASTTPATTTTLSEADHFRTIAVDLWTARNDLYQNPPADPEAALAEIFDRQCDCFQLELEDLSDLAARGVRYVGSPATPLGARFGEVDVESRIASAQLALDATPRQLVAADGTVVEERTGGDAYAVTLGLIEQQGRWLVIAVVPLDVDEQFISVLIAEAVP